MITMIRMTCALKSCILNEYSPFQIFKNNQDIKFALIKSSLTIDNHIFDMRKKRA